MYILKKKKKTKQRTNLNLPDGRRIRDWVKGVKGLRSRNCELQNSHEDVKYSIGNRVNNV